MKRLLTLLVLLVFSTASAWSQGGEKRFDSTRTKQTQYDSVGIPANTGGRWAVGQIRGAGTGGVWWVTGNLATRLDQQSTVIVVDSTLNIISSGDTVYLGVDTLTVVETKWNSILRAKGPGIIVEYSAFGPDSISADTLYLATQDDLMGFGWFFGDGSDGDIAPTVDTILSRDMYANNLTLNAGITLYPSGYRIFVYDTLNIDSLAVINDTGAVGNNGGAGGDALLAGGGNGDAGTQGAAQTAKGDGYLVRGGAGGQSGNGGGGRTGSGINGLPGAAGATRTLCIGSNGAAGGNGGDMPTPYTGGAGGAGGTCTVPGPTIGRARNTIEQYLNRSFSPTAGAGVSIFYPMGYPGGGGGGANGSNSAGFGINNAGSGGGGGGGQNGGVIWIAARIITGKGTITARGGNGGAGGKGGDAANGTVTNASGAGGGGGGGGSGGLVGIFYKRIGSITIIATGGSGGVAGAGGSVSGTNPIEGGDGVNGSTGTTGLTFLFKL